MRGVLLGVLLIVMIPLAGLSGTAVAAEDEWPGECDDAPILDSGTYTGSIDSPDDDDYFVLDMDKGEYYAMHVLVPDEQDEFELSGYPFGRYSNAADDYNVPAIRNESDVEASGEELTNFRGGTTARAEFWANEDGLFCFDVDDTGEGEIPYEWQISLERNDPEPASFEVTDLQEENDELRSQVDALEENVSELESEVEAKNERIAELESRLEDANTTIEVTVAPEERASFEVGGEMRVTVDAEGASSSDVSLGFDGEEYTPSDGEAAIPLSSAGAQELSVNYEDETESVAIDVTADETTDEAESGEDASDGDGSAANGESESDGESTSGDDASGVGTPGFGIPSGLAGLVGAGYLLRRRRSE